jgi:hypothetical protein
MDSYGSKKDALESLTKGTLEFKEALMEANDEAWKLIEQYSDLKYNIGSDGLITIDPDSYNAVKEAEFEKLNKQRTASIIASQYAKDMALEAKMTEFNRDVAKDNK